MAVAGFNCAIRRGGIPTATTAEPLTNVAGTVYQITSEARRCLDINAPWHLTDAGGTVDYANINNIDFLFGEVDVTGAAGSLTFSGQFIPLTTASDFLSEVVSHSLTESSDLLDTTVYNEGASNLRKRIYGLADANLTIDMLLNSLDMVSLSSLHTAGAVAVIDVNSGYSPRFRAFGRIVSLERSGSVDGRVEASVEWQLAAQRDTNTGTIQGYSDRLLTS